MKIQDSYDSGFKIMAIIEAESSNLLSGRKKGSVTEFQMIDCNPTQRLNMLPDREIQFETHL